MTADLCAAALDYAAMGYGAFPCKPQSKRPASRHGLTDATTDRAQLESWWQTTPKANVGLLPPGDVLVLDADTKAALEAWQARYSELRRAPLARTPGGGGHLYVLMPSGATAPPTATKIDGEPIDVRGLGKAYLVAPPSVRPEGAYTWERPLVAPHGLPLASPELLAALSPKQQEAAAQATYTPPAGADHARRYALSALQQEHDNVASASAGQRNHILNRAAFALGQLVAAGALERGEVEDALRAAASTAGLPAGEAVATLKSGLEAGMKEPREIPEPKRGKRAAGKAKKTQSAEPDLLEFLRTDYGNAERLVALHGASIRFCSALGWRIWDGRRWEKDDGPGSTRKALETARILFSQAARQPDSDRRADWIKHSLACEKRAALENAITLAKSIPGVSVNIGDFDQDPMLLNVMNGTIDLRTGMLRPHRREDLITKLAPVTYDPAADCPQWLAFQDTITAGDRELAAFKQRALGHSITGKTNEEVLIIAYGSGANGKTTEMNAIGKILGDYAGIAQFDTFAIKKNEGVRDDIADLAGARFISASEGESRQRLAEGLVKQLTGGDPMKARHLYRDLFTFTPTFKLWLATNHKPIIRGTDHGIWRRIRLVPYTVTIAEETRDKNLKHKLEAEYSGILNWLLEGCKDWQAQGLGTAKAVKDATNRYKEDSDVLSGFLSNRCVVDELCSAPTKELYDAYTAWCNENGDEAFTSTVFGRLLHERGYPSGTVRKDGKVTRIRTGICLQELEGGEANL
jgi:putative DNA primase/helicase